MTATAGIQLLWWNSLQEQQEGEFKDRENLYVNIHLTFALSVNETSVVFASVTGAAAVQW